MNNPTVFNAQSSNQAHRKHLSIINDRIIGTWKSQNVRDIKITNLLQGDIVEKTARAEGTQLNLTESSGIVPKKRWKHSRGIAASRYKT